jgi:hypothetical protein
VSLQIVAARILGGLEREGGSKKVLSQKGGREEEKVEGSEGAGDIKRGRSEQVSKQRREGGRV